MESPNLQPNELSALSDSLAPRLAPATVPLLRREGTTKPFVEGSGVLLRLDDEIFILTACHVLDQFDSSLLTEHNKELISLQGMCVKADAPLDAGIVLVKGGMSIPGLADRALHMSDLDPFRDRLRERSLLLGYPWKRTKAFQGDIDGTRKPIVSKNVQVGQYASLGFDAEFSLLLEWNKRWISRDGPHDAWNIEGCSGGGIWSLELENPKLIGIFWGFPDEHQCKKVFVGTRIHAHLDLIARCCPTLLPRLSDFVGSLRSIRS